VLEKIWESKTIENSEELMDSSFLKNGLKVLKYRLLDNVCVCVCVFVCVFLYFSLAAVF
jgi:hypothetical protein